MTEYELRMEQNFLAAFWADPVRGLEMAEHCGGLTAKDFWGDGHSCTFTYLAACAESNRTPNENEAVVMSRATCGELSRERLRPIVKAAILIPLEDSEHFAREVWECSQGRLTSETWLLIEAAAKEWNAFQDWLARGGLRAHQPEEPAPAKRTTGPRRKGFLASTADLVQSYSKGHSCKA